MKLIIADRFNVYQMDRTLWYTIDYDMLNSIMKVSNESDIDMQNESMEDNQNELMEECKTTPAIPENTTKISSKNINPSIYQENEMQETDGLTDSLENKEIDLEAIISNCELECISDIYRDAVYKAIYLLVYEVNTLENIRIGNVFVPKEIAKVEIMKLNHSILDHALDKYKDVSKTTRIKSPIGYLKSCIYNAISETSIDIVTGVRYDMEMDAYRKKYLGKKQE